MTTNMIKENFMKSCGKNNESTYNMLMLPSVGSPTDTNPVPENDQMSFNLSSNTSIRGSLRYLRLRKALVLCRKVKS